MQENAEALRNKNFRFEIDEVEGTLKALYELQADLEQRLEDPAFRQLVKTHEIVSGIIEVMHDTLRLLQKHTLKTPLAEPSEEAKIAVGHSSKTVNKIFYDR